MNGQNKKKHKTPPQQLRADELEGSALLAELDALLAEMDAATKKRIIQIECADAKERARIIARLRRQGIKCSAVRYVTTAQEKDPTLPGQ